MDEQLVASAIVVDEGRILMVCKRGAWFLPGGKPEGPDEDDLACVERECIEEVEGLKITCENLYGTFPGISPHSKRRIRVNAYLSSFEVTGPLQPVAGSEISAVDWFTYEEAQTKSVTEAMQKVLDSLRSRGRL